MKDLIKIGETANTWNPVLELIMKKGYKITIEDYGHEDRYWLITKVKGKEIIASDPLKFFGLILLVEEKGDEWCKAEENYFNLL